MVAKFRGAWKDFALVTNLALTSLSMAKLRIKSSCKSLELHPIEAPYSIELYKSMKQFCEQFLSSLLQKSEDGRDLEK